MKRIIFRKIKQYFFCLSLTVALMTSFTMATDFLSNQTPERLYTLVKNVEYRADKGCKSSQACMLLFLAYDIKRDFSAHIQQNWGEKVDLLWCEKKLLQKISFIDKDWLLKDLIIETLNFSIENKICGGIISKIYSFKCDDSLKEVSSSKTMNSFIQSPNDVHSLLSYIEKRGDEGCRSAQIFTLLLLAHDVKSDFAVYEIWSKPEGSINAFDPLWSERFFLNKVSPYVNKGWVKAFDIQHQIMKLIFSEKTDSLIKTIHGNGIYYS